MGAGATPVGDLASIRTTRAVARGRQSAATRGSALAPKVCLLVRFSYVL